MELLTLGRDPVRPDQPAGADARYEPVFEELQAEVDKPPSASGGVDWAKVLKLSSEILSQKSKDLVVASYLSVALIQLRKFEGVEIGCRIYRDLLENHWDALFPAKARMRGRIAAIEWWVERAEGLLEQLPKGPFPDARIDALRENVETVDRLLTELLDEPPSIRPFLDFVGSLEAVAPPPAPAAPAPQAAPARAPEGTVATLGAEALADAPTAEEGPVVIASAETAAAVLEKAVGDVARVADYYREESLGNASAYRLARVAAWSQVEALPPSENGRTLLPAPYTAEVVRGLREPGQEESLLRAAEENLVQNIFWLDLNFYSWEALSRLGEGYEAASAAVRGETALLLSRLPGLEDLAFADGTPFAADDTREWLKGLQAGVGAASGGTTGPAADPTAGEVRRARELIGEGRATEAIRRLQHRQRASVSRRESYLFRVAVCLIILETPDVRYALPHADEILKEIEAFRLEEYDPETALKGLQAAWKACRANADAVPPEKIADLLGRIARMDVSAAMSLGSE